MRLEYIAEPVFTDIWHFSIAKLSDLSLNTTAHLKGYTIVVDDFREVFISYHEKSAGKLVEEIANRLESAGISCWYAKRDLLLGEDFAKHIPKQINNCKVFLFILNQGANTSEHMGNEIGLAFRRKDKGITIIPYQVEKCNLASWLRDYYLVRIQIASSETLPINALVTEVAHKLGREPEKNGWCGVGARWMLKDTTLTIFKDEKYNSNGEMGDFYPQYIPEYINVPWWNERKKITHLIIQYGVTKIGESAFRGCTNLKTADIPNSIASIGDGAFSDCGNLTNVYIPYNVISIGDWTFDSCSKLRSVKMPNSVISIGKSAFWGCSNLVSVEIPDSVIQIKDGAFLGCNNLIRVSVPANAKIAKTAFAKTTEVTRRPTSICLTTP